MTEDNTPRIDRRFEVSIDWHEVPVVASNGAVIVKGKRGTVKIKVSASRASQEQIQEAKGRFASLGAPSGIAAPQATRNLAVDGVRWRRSGTTGAAPGQCPLSGDRGERSAAEARPAARISCVPVTRGQI